jgi:hypothetical protein
MGEKQKPEDKAEAEKAVWRGAGVDHGLPF